MEPPIINVNIIRIFEGPRHDKLEAIWRWYTCLHSNQMTLHVFDNTHLRLPHDRAYERMWVQEENRPEQFTIFTEFDFLPGADFLNVRPASILAAEYCTRDPSDHRLQRRGIPGAWFVTVDKNAIKYRPDFRSGGPFNDPCNEIDAELLDTQDCYPDHYGVEVAFVEVALNAIGRHTTERFHIGTHLFWSRHYNDDPNLTVGEFPLRPILEGVDTAIKDFVACQK